MNLCPNCGRPLGGRLQQVKIAYAGYKRRRWAEFQSSADNALEPWAPKPPPQLPGSPGGYFEAHRERPARAMNVESDVITPLFQAMALAAFVTGAFYLAGYVFIARITWLAACFSGLVSGGVFFFLVVLANRRLLWIAESVINDDVDNDGRVGQPPPAPPSPRPPLEVLHRDERGNLRAMHRLDLPNTITDERLAEFAQGAPVKGLAQGVWTGRAGLFSRSEFDALMAELERAGIVAWVDPANRSQGRKLTRAGQSALRYWSQTQDQTRASTRAQAAGAQIGKFDFIE